MQARSHRARPRYRSRLAELMLCPLLLASSLAGFATGAHAQSAYPSKAIRFIVPYPTGGAADPIARMIGAKLSESWGQPVIVENRPGGNTIIGAEALARSAPDGHTIGLVANTHVMIPSMLPKLPFDAIKDFTPVSTVALSGLVLVVHPSVAANDVQQLVALAKSKPDTMTFASTSTGAPSHLAGEMLNTMAGTQIRHVPYKGGGPAITDTIGGQVHMYFSAVPLAVPHIKAGKLRPIAVTDDTRDTGLPDVPTFAEAGIPGFNLAVWYGVLAPAGTPAPIVERLAAELGRIMALPDVRESLSKSGNRTYYKGPVEFAELMRTDMEKYARLVRAANIRIEN